MSALIAALVSPPIAYVSARLQLQLNMARHDLQKLVCEDALTGAATRTFFSESVQHLMGDNSRDNLPACMLMIDIDHFKDVNDTRGHAAGDEVLREFTSVLRTGLRPTDILGRYGGEEFAVLLPCTNATVGREVAERLRLNTFSNSKLAAMAGRSVTISVGMVSLEQSTDLDNMLAAADRALYRAKNQGRDQVCETVSVRRPEFRST